MIQTLILVLSLFQAHADHFEDFKTLRRQFVSQSSKVTDSSLDKTLTTIATKLFHHNPKDIYAMGYTFTDVANVLELIVTTDRGTGIIGNILSQSPQFKESQSRILKIFETSPFQHDLSEQAARLQQVVFYLSQVEDEGFDDYALVGNNLIVLLASSLPYLAKDSEKVIDSFEHILIEIFSSASPLFLSEIRRHLVGERFIQRFETDSRLALSSRLLNALQTLATPVTLMPIGLAIMQLGQTYHLISSGVPTIQSQYLITTGILAFVNFVAIQLLGNHRAHVQEKLRPRINEQLMKCRSLLNR